MLVVLVGVWAGRAAARVTRRGMAGSPCFPSVPGALCLARWGFGSPSLDPHKRDLIAQHVFKVLAHCYCPSCVGRIHILISKASGSHAADGARLQLLEHLR